MQVSTNTYIRLCQNYVLYRLSIIISLCYSKYLKLKISIACKVCNMFKRKRSTLRSITKKPHCCSWLSRKAPSSSNRKHKNFSAVSYVSDFSSITWLNGNDLLIERARKSKKYGTMEEVRRSLLQFTIGSPSKSRTINLHKNIIFLLP